MFNQKPVGECWILNLYEYEHFFSNPRGIVLTNQEISHEVFLEKKTKMSQQIRGQDGHVGYRITLKSNTSWGPILATSYAVVLEKKLQMSLPSRSQSSHLRFFNWLSLVNFDILKVHVLSLRFGLVLWCLTPLSTIFQLYRPAASHWQTLSHNVVHLSLSGIRTHNISGDRHRLQR